MDLPSLTDPITVSNALRLPFSRISIRPVSTVQGLCRSDPKRFLRTHTVYVVLEITPMLDNL